MFWSDIKKKTLKCAGMVSHSVYLKITGKVLKEKTSECLDKEAFS